MRYKNLVAYLITTALGFFFVVTSYYYQKHQQLTSQVITQTAKQSLHQLVYSEREYLNVSSQFGSLVKLLSHSHNLYDYLQDPTLTRRQVVEEVWSSVAVNQKWFTQIRFLNLEGMEEIRINYRSNEINASPAAILQDKSSRDYFTYAQSLKENQIGSWGIDLEVEHDEFVLPYQPALRLLTPVVVEGDKKGYLVLNIDVWYLASLLNYSPDRRFSPEVIGEHGYYLAGEQQNKLFGHLLPQRSQFNFAHQFPQTWATMQNQKSGYLLESDHLVIFNRISLSVNQSLFLINSFDREELDQEISEGQEDLFQEATIVFLLALVLVLPATLIILHYHNHRLESQLARAALSGMSAVVISDKQHQAMLINDQFSILTGYSQEEVEKKNIVKLLMGESHFEKTLEILEQIAKCKVWEGELSFNKPGSSKALTIILRVQGILTKSGKVSYYISSIVDITDRKELEERLRVLSEKDALTQLWNRRKFESELKSNSRLLERYVESQYSCLALLDIDYFKRINDELGHDEGDKVIKNVAKAIEASLRDTDFVARIGGEEFAIIMPQTNLVEAEMALNRLRVAIEIDDAIPVTVSIGVTDLTANSTESYKAADIALYDSKSLGRNSVSVCTSSEGLA